MSEPRLIFLISQPRSGSTLLQHILAAHPAVATLPEPWLMLPLVYIRRSGGHTAEFNSEYAHIALEDFVKRVPDGEVAHLSATRQYAMQLYKAAAATNPEAAFFLDKTPRYYFIIEELRRIFPDAGIVILVRNPLAVLASILNYNYNGNWISMSNQADRRHDLVTAPNIIARAVQVLGSDVVKVKYEKLVTDSESEMRRICDGLGLKFDPDMLNYGKRNHFTETTFVDTKSVYRHERAVTDYMESWRGSCNNLERACLALAYLDCLEDKVLTVYGESRMQLEDLITEHQPSLRSRGLLRRRHLMKASLLKGYASLTRSQKLFLDWRRVMRHRLARWIPLRLVLPGVSKNK